MIVYEALASKGFKGQVEPITLWARQAPIADENKKTERCNL